jgi:hypothetical protein
MVSVDVRKKPSEIRRVPISMRSCMEQVLLNTDRMDGRKLAAQPEPLGNVCVADTSA